MNTNSVTKSFAGVSFALLLTAFVHATDPTAYVTGGNDFWGTLDLANGVYTNLGVTGTLLAGIGGYNGSIYGGGLGSQSLYKVNTSNGSLTFIGTSLMTYRDVGSTTSGVYALDNTGELYKINVVNGEATGVGNIGLAYNGGIGLSSGAGELYFADGLGGTTLLYQISTTTGAATLLGSTGAAGAIGGMVAVGGSLYASADAPVLSVWNLNPATGVAFGEETTPSLPGDCSGLATPSSSPEPVTTGLSLAGIGLFLRRRMTRTSA